MQSNGTFTKVLSSKSKSKDWEQTKPKDKKGWKNEQRKQTKRNWIPKEFS